MERIAEDAGVPVQSLYYTFRSEGQLLCQVVEATAAGDDRAAPVAQRAWVQDMLTATSAQRVLALAVEDVPTSTFGPSTLAGRGCGERRPSRSALLAAGGRRTPHRAGPDGYQADRAGRAAPRPES